jgi:hypothetical protein
MAIDFPASPTLNDVFTVGNVTYVWDGTKWTASVTGGISLDKIEEGNTSAEVIDTGSDGRFVVTTEGTERLRVTNTGLVGIGTASPNQALETVGTIRSTQTGSTGYYFRGYRSSTTSSFYVYDDGTNIQLTNEQSGALKFHTANTERVRIDSSGRLGIGTSSPSVSLHVVGGGMFASSTTGGSIVQARNSDFSSLGYFGVEGSTGGVTLTGTLANSTFISSGASGTPLQFGTGGVIRSTLTSTGLGIGTTSPSQLLHLSVSSGVNYIRTSNGTVDYYNGINSSNEIYIGSTTIHPITFRIGDSEKTRIDTSGRLLVGTSTARAVGVTGPSEAPLQIETPDSLICGLALIQNRIDSYGPNLRFGKTGGTTVGSVTAVSEGHELGTIQFCGADGTDLTSVGALIRAQVDGTPGTNDMPGRLVFSTTADGASSPTERMRITRGGDLFSLNADNGIVSRSTLPAGTSNTIFAGQHSAASIISGTNCFRVYTNGNVQNTNNSYGALSDIKLKENIVDAHSQWDDLKALQVRNYNFKEGQTHTQIGLVAQEVELVSPGLVSESPDRDEDGNDLGTVTKSVNYSVLYMKAVKALQEAMERIETLEGMVAVNNITIDEQQHQLSTLAARLTALETP